MNNPIERASVEVLLATYNGERHLAEQLDSLLAQSFSGFSIIVSDDGSSDRTLDILERYMLGNPGKFRLLPPHGERLGANRNFGRLLDAATADYVSFCDQDDIWFPEKLELSVKQMNAVMKSSAPGKPILVHSDLTVVDDKLQVIGDSFFAYSGVDPDRNHLGALLLGNIATGCTLLANRALYECARPIPAESMMFDFWLAQVASALGTISLIEAPTLLYRQHEGNLIGARRAGAASFIKRVENTLLNDRTLLVLSRFSLQAQALLERYGDMMRTDDREKAATLAGIWNLPKWKRLAALLAAGLRKHTISANIALAALLLRNRPRSHGQSAD